MPHDVVGVAVVQDTSKGFCQVIGGVDHIRDELHNNGPGFFPVLDGKVLDVNVTGALRGHTSVDHIDGRLVIAVHDCRAFRREAEVCHDCSHVLSMLRGGNSGKEPRFGGAGSSDRLHFALVRDGATTEEEGVACSRSAVTQIIGVCGIKECNGFLGIPSGKNR